MGRLVVIVAVLCSGPARAQQGPEMVPVDPAAEIAPAPTTPTHTGATSVTRLGLGFGIRTIYRIPFLGAQGEAAMGTERGRNAYYFTLRLFGGASVFGLPAFQPQLGFLWERKHDALRVGLGGETGVFLIRRATNGELIPVFTTGPRVVLSYDLHRSSQGTAFFLHATVGLDIVFFAASPIFEAGIGFGVRFPSL